MASEMIQELIDAGIHFGHRTSRWNPKMKPYIYGKRNNLHIIDVKETLRGLLLAKKFINQTVAKGKDVLFVGTKRQARKSVQTHGDRIEMHWVNDRWLGGTLTNFREIRKRIARLEELEAMENEGRLDAYSKKEGSRLRREMRKIHRNLGGIRNMKSHPGVMVIIDPVREKIAVAEARKAGVPIVSLIDTDGDPDTVDIAIPGNEDAMRAIEVIVRELADAAAAATQTRIERTTEGEDQAAPRRRSQRVTTSAAYEEAAADAPVAEAVAPVEVAPAPVAEAVAPVEATPAPVAEAVAPVEVPAAPAVEAPAAPAAPAVEAPAEAPAEKPAE